METADFDKYLTNKYPGYQPKKQLEEIKNKNKLENLKLPQFHFTTIRLSEPFTSVASISAKSILGPISTKIPEKSDKINECSTSESLIGKIQPRDLKIKVDELNFDRLMPVYSDNMLKKIQVISDQKVTPTRASSSTQRNISLSEIENLYYKYFSKEVQDTIFVIANILNVIVISNKHKVTRYNESFKNKTEAEKLNERCVAYKMHTKHANILESELMTNFIKVISFFNESDFKLAFELFILSISLVMKMLNKSTLIKGNNCKNTIYLLWNSLKKKNYANSKVFNLFRSESFQSDCINIFKLIENNKNIDPSITDRMEIFFVSRAINKDYFQKVIDAVTNSSSDNLGILIDEATRLCCQNSMFKNPAEYWCSVGKICNNKVPVVLDIQSPNKIVR